MFWISIILVISAGILLWIAHQQRVAAGLPGGRIIYNDTRAWSKVEKPLYDPILRLVGKPDYLIKQHDIIIPVEVKSSQVYDAPYDGHIYQLAAYCMLVYRTYNTRPPYGVLKYINRTYAIDYTQELESSCNTILEEMRSQISNRNIPRSHSYPHRCKRCGYRNSCEQRLTGK
jgi:CRISPR-associated exonuclease Cas4